MANIVKCVIMATRCTGLRYRHSIRCELSLRHEIECFSSVLIGRRKEVSKTPSHNRADGVYFLETLSRVR